MEPRKYLLQCSRCKVGIETFTEPAHKMNGFLCNSCWLKWKDIEAKLLGHVYEDEMRKAFIHFVNSMPFLKTQI